MICVGQPSGTSEDSSRTTECVHGLISSERVRRSNRRSPIHCGGVGRKVDLFLAV